MRSRSIQSPAIILVQQKKYFISGCLLLLLTATIEMFLAHQVRDLYFHLALKTPEKTVVQLFYDLGQGFTEENSQHYTINKIKSSTSARLPLPGGKNINRFRLDPVTSTVEVKLSNLKIIDVRGKTIHRIMPEQINVIGGIEQITMQNNTFTILPDLNKDPRLRIDFPEPIKTINGYNSTRFCLIFIVGYLFYIFILIGNNYFLKTKKNYAKDFGIKFKYFQNKLFLTSVLMIILVISVCYYFFRGKIENSVARSTSDDVKVFQNGGDDRQVVFNRSDGLRIVGSLYGIDGDSHKEKPGIILFHGNMMFGRKTPLIQIMAESLAHMGYIVMTIDFSGFGESDSPFALKGNKDWDINLDAHEAIDYFTSIDKVSLDQISLVGHSMGAGPAIEVGISRPEIRSIIAMGPPRRVTELYNESRWREFFWELAQRYHRELYRIDLPAWYTQKIWAKNVIKNDMTQFIPYFLENHHKPILLMEAQNINPKDRKFLRDYYDLISYPKEFITINGVDHFWDTSYKDEKLYYRPKAMKETVKHVDQWMRRSKNGLFMLHDKLRNSLTPFYWKGVK